MMGMMMVMMMMMIRMRMMIELDSRAAVVEKDLLLVFLPLVLSPGVGYLFFRILP